MSKEIRINAFAIFSPSHLSAGLWRHPRDKSVDYNQIETWTELALILERGKFDGLFLADGISLYDTYGGSAAASIRTGAQFPKLDPLLLVPALAQVTKHLGFGVTSSVSYEAPYLFARRMSTLDHLTKGRVGWNIVTSYLPNAARNFGLDGEVPHDERYLIADEYLDVLYKLWEGSWDDDAVIEDRERRIYADPAKVRYINHAGKHFRVQGPHLSEPSRQRTPLLFQATGSNAGKAFAARHAEVVFTGGMNAEAVRANIADMRARARDAGRDPQHIKFITGAGIIVGRTDDEVAAKLDDYRRYISAEARLAHAQSRIDYMRYRPEETIADIVARKDAGWDQIPPRFRPEQTIGEVVAQLRSVNYGRYFVAGTPEIVADAIETWLDEDDLDGINLIQYLSFTTARDFIELVVPELRRRGRFRERYTDGETLRERLIGPGLARLPGDHYGARYRNPANLSIPGEALHIPGRDDSPRPAPLSDHEFRERAAANAGAGT
jgi:FMN-dependent oxidoreductase (nitrilotriacetate monooxygenase family)